MNTMTQFLEYLLKHNHLDTFVSSAPHGRVEISARSCRVLRTFVSSTPHVRVELEPIGRKFCNENPDIENLFLDNLPFPKDIFCFYLFPKVLNLK